MGNVLVTISDKKIGVDANGDGAIDYYNADVVTANDYYAFGSQMPGRIFIQGNSKYRYGFNGKENDNDLKGTGNQQDYGMRIYDPRVAKFLSVDPISKKYPELTTYQFASNNPISGVDLDGLEFYYTPSGALAARYGNSTQVRVLNADFAKNNQGKTILVSILNANSTAIGITNEELNTRAILTVVRRSENNGGRALPYNTWNSYTKSGAPQTFTDKDYSEDPQAYKSHPGINPKNKPHTQSGAYQIIEPTWNNVIKPLNHPQDFGPVEQDKAFLTLLNEQEKYNPKKVGLLSDIRNGDFESAVKKLNGTWTSLPGGSQQLLTMDQANKIFKESLASELAGKSVVGTPQGQLTSNQETKK